jgi:hypothetical protein
MELLLRIWLKMGIRLIPCENNLFFSLVEKPRQNPAKIQMADLQIRTILPCLNYLSLLQKQIYPFILNKFDPKFLPHVSSR